MLGPVTHKISLVPILIQPGLGLKGEIYLVLLSSI